MYTIIESYIRQYTPPFMYMHINMPSKFRTKYNTRYIIHRKVITFHQIEFCGTYSAIYTIIYVLQIEMILQFFDRHALVWFVFKVVTG